LKEGKSLKDKFVRAMKYNQLLAIEAKIKKNEITLKKLKKER